MKIIIATLVFLVVAGGGCSSTVSPTRYYTLAPADVPPSAQPAASGRDVRIGIRAVDLPRYVERPQIVTRAGINRLEVDEFQQWGEPLRHAMPMILAENLARLVPTEQVAVFPWGRGFVPDAQIFVDVWQLEGALGGQTTLAARWRIVSRAGEETATGVSRLTESSGSDYESLVAAHSRLVAALSRDIAEALRRGGVVSTR
jgi:uncharacterized lipoprotein YmbA